MPLQLRSGCFKSNPLTIYTVESFTYSLLSELILSGFNEFRNKSRLDSLQKPIFKIGGYRVVKF